MQHVPLLSAGPSSMNTLKRPSVAQHVLSFTPQSALSETTFRTKPAELLPAQCQSVLLRYYTFLTL
ncbi:hypothetical protein ACM41X_004680, partial [Salmonella enterica subsp. enterica]